MADQKISQLNPITGVNVSDVDDTLAIVDTSAAETKKITRDELFNGPDLKNGSVENTPVGQTTPAAGSFLGLTSETFKNTGSASFGTTLDWTFAPAWMGLKVTDRHALQATHAASSVAISSNAAIGSTGWEYTVTGVVAGKITTSGNTFIWDTAVAGTDGGAVTWNEQMRLNSTGLGIGTNSPVAKVQINETAANCKASITSSDTGIAQISFGDQTSPDEGYIQYNNASNAMVLGTNSLPQIVVNSAGLTRPAADNTQDFGAASYRWQQIFAGSGTINTSDGREKEQVEPLSSKELRVACRAKSLLRKYKMVSSVSSKGAAARWHFGIVAQDLASEFALEGLDPWEYGVLCRDYWYEADVFDEETGEFTRETFTDLESVPSGSTNFTLKDRLGVRYDELFAFILAAL